MTLTGTDPLWMQNVTYDGNEDRWLMEALASDGVVNAGDCKVTQRAAGTNMSVDVAAGLVFVPGTDNPLTQGTYLCRLQAVANVTLDAAPSAGTSRYDLIVAEVRDGQVNLGPNHDWQLRAIKGTAASTPVEPTLPPSCVVLARVTIASGTAAITNGMILDRRYFAKDWAVGASGNLPRGRPRSVVVETNTGAIKRGNVDGSWTDIRAGMPRLQSLAGPPFGTPPSLATTPFYEAIFGQEVFAINGVGNVAIPYTFTGGIAHASITLQLNTTPGIVAHRTDFPGSGVTTGNNFPVTMFVWDQPSHDWVRLNGGSMILLCRIIGW
jgi:hypothetical protein